jgi:hypothetical protein
MFCTGNFQYDEYGNEFPIDPNNNCYNDYYNYRDLSGIYFNEFSSLQQNEMNSFYLIIIFVFFMIL